MNHKVFSECYVCRCSVKFSLSGRDSDSNLLLSSSGVFLGLTHASPIREQVGHLWYDSGIAAPISVALLGLPLC